MRVAGRRKNTWKRTQDSGKARIRTSVRNFTFDVSRLQRAVPRIRQRFYLVDIQCLLVLHIRVESLVT
jgi:hypothetical protein